MLQVPSRGNKFTGVSLSVWSSVNCKSLKTSEPQNEHHKKRHTLFYFNGKELPIHWLTIADVFRDVFVIFISSL